MRNFLKFHFGLLLVFALGFGCFPSTTDSSNEENAKKDPTPEQKLREQKMETMEKLADVLESFERMAWNKPDLIIGMMEGLENKTVADIGAGSGYFAFRMVEKAKKVIAIDIDPQAIDFINEEIKNLDETKRDKLEARLVEPHDPKLKTGEADIVLFSNVYIYIEDRTAYLKNLQKGMSPGGQVFIIDYKKKYTPQGPPTSLRLSPSQVEEELTTAGFRNIRTDDTSLDYQYIVVANRP